MKEGDLGTVGFREFDEDGIERFDATFGEVFEEATEGDEVVTLGGDGEAAAMFVFDAVETEAVFAEELGSDFVWS